MVYIKRTIDLTSKNFQRIDFQEAEIIEFDLRKKNLDTVAFEIWGARLKVDYAWKHDKSFLPGVPHTDDYYVSGTGKIRIENTTGIKVTFSPYMQRNGRLGFCYDSSGKIIEEHKQLGITANVRSNYIWECPVIAPPGFANIYIWADGPVTYEFDDKDMIFEKEFFRDMKKYRLPR